MLRDLRGQLPVHPTLRYGTRPLEGIIGIAIHHSGTPADSSAKEIARYHVEHNGWPGCGYWAVLRFDGTTELCWDHDVASYHIAGRNQECLGICVVGDLTQSLPTKAQIKACRYLVASIRRTLRRNVPVKGHRELALPGHETICPGGSWESWRHELG